MERIALEIGGSRREYLLAAPGGPGPPLVLFLHGVGATAEWADGETGWSALARREGFALALPQGLCPDPTRPPKFLTNPARWNDLSPSAREASLTADDVAFLAAVVADAQARIGPGRVFVTGFSNGAGMAFRLAAERADLVAAVAPVAGHCWVADPRPARPVPTLYVIGSVDPLVPLRGGEVRSPWQHRYVRRPPVADTLERWARAVGCDPVAKTQDPTPNPLPGLGAAPAPQSGLGEGRQTSPPPLTGKGVGGVGSSVRLDTYPGPVAFHTVTIGGLGHHWPGGRGGLNHRIAGPPSDRVNGTELVWDFLRRHDT